MPVPAHTRITWSGTLGAINAPVEDFSFRLNFAAPTNPGNMSAIAQAAHAAYVARLLTITQAHCQLRSVKVALIGADGQYTTDAVTYDSTAAGTLDGYKYPFQTALAVSLLTGTRGAKGRGRFYLAGVGYSISADTGQIDSAVMPALNTAASGFLNDCNNISGLNALVVASSSGVLSPVTAFRVGRAYDTIRSRRTKVDEAYAPASPVVVSQS